MVIEDNSSSLPVGHRPIVAMNSNSNPVGHRIAHPIDRMAAFVVDTVILFFTASLLVSPLQKKIKAAQLVNQSEQILIAMAIGILVLGLLCVAYQFLFNRLLGGTPGKRFFGLKVVDVWQGMRPSNFDLLMRAVTWWFDCLAICLPHFGIYSDPLRRPFHDRVSNTVVVSTSHRRGKAPELSEVLFIRAAFLILYFVGFAVVFGTVKHTYELISFDENADLLSIVSPEYCEDVSLSQPDWPLERGLTANRVSIALALFASGQATEECLDKEAFLEFQSGDKKDLAYLARAFATSDDSDLSDKYLEKVCEISPDGEACHLSKLISFWTEHAWDKATDGFNSALTDASVYMKAWAIKHFEKVKDYKREMTVINELSPLKGVNEFLATHRAVALWGLHREPESLVALQSAIEVLSTPKQMGISSWMCYNQLEQSCSTELPSSCQRFLKLSDESTVAYEHDLYSVTHFKIAKCKGENSFDELQELNQDPRVSSLLKAVKSEENGNVSDAIAIYHDIADNADASTLAYHEATASIMRLVDKHNDSEIDSLLEVWAGYQPADLWGWISFGKSLTRTLIRVNRFSDAQRVAEAVLKLDTENKEVNHLMVIASYRNSDFNQAKKYSIISHAEKTTRSPASANEDEEYKDILKSLEKGK